MLKKIKCLIGKHAWGYPQPIDGAKCLDCGRQYIDPNLHLHWL